MTQIVTDDIADFVTELSRHEVAEKTVRSYRSDLAGFVRWFEGSAGEPFRAGGVTPTTAGGAGIRCATRSAISAPRRVRP